MSIQNQFQRRESATAVFAVHCPNRPAASVVDSLASGLTLLRDLLTTRLHEDVEVQFGFDSMVAPLSPSLGIKQIQRASAEIDSYATVVVDDEVSRGEYIDVSGAWFLDWLIQLPLGDDWQLARSELADPYRGLSDNARRLRFASNLRQAVPESVKAPPVLFLLFPLAVRIVAAAAFGDAQRTQTVRAEQIALLPAIGDCPDCYGRVLGNGERCTSCGNPLWTFDCLRAV